METNEMLTKEQMRQKWSALTEGDLEGIATRKVPLAGKLQERYGYGKEQAEREAEEFLRIHPEAIRETNVTSAQSPTPTSAMTAQLPVADRPPATPYSPPWTPTMPAANEYAAPQPTAAPQPIPSEYTRSAIIWIGPRLVHWTIRITAVALVIFLFLPWTGLYPAGYGVYTQNAFQMIWGGTSVDPVGARALDPMKPFDSVPGNGLMLLYVALVLLAFVLVVAPLVLTPARVERIPKSLRFIGRGRLGLLGTVAFTALVVLIAQWSTRFGLDEAVAAKADAKMANEVAAAVTPEEQQTASIHRAIEMGPLHLRHTSWLWLAVTAHVLLIAGVGLQYWLNRRGNRPLPRIEALA